METIESPKGTRLGRLVPLAVLVAGFALFFALGLHHQVTLANLKANREALALAVAAHPLLAPALFIAAYALAVACSIPASWVFTVTSGFLFGMVEGTLVAMCGATIGATLVFLATRTALAEFFERRAGAAIRKLEAGFRRNAFNYLFALRLIPVMPFFLVNLAAGILGVNLRTFVIATFIGIIPACIVYVGIGNGLGSVFEHGAEPDLGLILRPQIFLPLLGLALLSLLPVLWHGFVRRPGTE